MSAPSFHSRLTMAFPVTYTFQIAGSWGGYFQKFTLNHFILPLGLEELADFARTFWDLAVAPATTIDTRLELVQWECHNHPGLNFMDDGGNRRGHLLQLPAAREDSAVIILSAGHHDAWDHQRIYFPGIPRSWVSEGVLTSAGKYAMEGHAKALFMGLGYDMGQLHYNWYTKWGSEVAAELGIEGGMALRQVNHLTVCEHTSRAPNNFF